MKAPGVLIDRVRYFYRKFILLWIPVRVYVLHTPLPPGEIVRKLTAVIFPFRLYYLFSPRTSLPYTGRFEADGFVAVRNASNPLGRSLKVIGKFYVVEQKIYVRLIFSNPFSLSNFFILALFYGLLYLMRIRFFESYGANLVLYAVPILLGYMATNLSFQRIYKREKVFFFRLFEGRRLKEDEITTLGI